MEKEKILFKMRDYNNELEKILEKKSFSETTKNLLLSMLYKIETAYGDYTTVKREVRGKHEYLEMIIKTIDQDCSVIHLVKPGAEEAKILEEAGQSYVVNPEKNEIYTYQNELSLLQAILEMAERDKTYSVKQEMLQKPVADFLKSGELNELLEVIKDFNGWSWNITKDEADGGLAKICYLNLVYLVGMETMKQMAQEKDVLSFLFAKLEKNYGAKPAKEFLMCLLQNILRIYAKKEKKYQKILEEQTAEWAEELERIQDKVGYLDSLTKEKRKIHNEIAKIDLLLNNNEQLRKTYLETNKKLPNEKKHFSVSTFAEKMEKNRKKLLEQMAEINALFEPVNFMAKRNEIQEKADFYAGIHAEDLKGKKEACFAKLQQHFWKLLGQKIEQAVEKKEVIDYIYELRYYRIQKQERGIKENNPAEEKKVKEKLLIKALQMKVCANLGKEEETSKIILALLFDTKIVCLQTISVQIQEQTKNTKIEIYDEKVLDGAITVEKLNWTEKNKKKRKLFD